MYLWAYLASPKLLHAFTPVLALQIHLNILYSLTIIRHATLQLKSFFVTPIFARLLITFVVYFQSDPDGRVEGAQGDVHQPKDDVHQDLQSLRTALSQVCVCVCVGDVFACPFAKCNTLNIEFH